MFSKLKAAWSRLVGSTSEKTSVPVVEYKGYRIRATPYLRNNHYQTAGAIERDTPDGPKKHKFVRADTHDSRNDAIAFSITKAKQLIDHLGDRMFT
jgi:hypothetical protein